MMVNWELSDRCILLVINNSIAALLSAVSETPLISPILIPERMMGSPEAILSPSENTTVNRSFFSAGLYSFAQKTPNISTIIANTVVNPTLTFVLNEEGQIGIDFIVSNYCNDVFDLGNNKEGKIKENKKY